MTNQIARVSDSHRQIAANVTFAAMAFPAGHVEGVVKVLGEPRPYDGKRWLESRRIWKATVSGPMLRFDGIHFRRDFGKPVAS